jgi:hypothetical protein
VPPSVSTITAPDTAMPTDGTGAGPIERTPEDPQRLHQQLDLDEAQDDAQAHVR